MKGLRSAFFYLGYGLWTALWGTLSLLLAWALPYRHRFRFIIGVWTSVVLTWLRWTCGVSYQVEGSRVPTTPCIVLANHQSTFETLMLQQLFAPQATVLKRELLRIPFFGWALALLKPIAIDRSQRIGALKQLIRTGRDRLQAGIWVVMLPEGTRSTPGTPGTFFRGGAALAHATATPIVMVAHNAGLFWPARQFLKHAGVVRVRISEPLDPAGKSVNEINALSERWIRETAAALSQISRLDTDKALDSMNSRRGST